MKQIASDEELQSLLIAQKKNIKPKGNKEKCRLSQIVRRSNHLQ